ncbi:Formin-like [Oopsacas minuta]|uniref:Formin-like n=1 Tax=Oopsacas minuta TaxID=111878 RepID=A0AAV7KAZ0_9METZ|nr:Formin-like [Oopsacas minuta]
MNQTYDSFSEAVGFNLELLPRLKETKAGDNSCTFLDFVSRCYLQTFEHNILQGSIINILPFPDTGDLFIASKITLKELYEALNNLGKQLTKVRENTRHFLEDNNQVSPNKFVEFVEKFFLFAERKIANEIEIWKVGEKAYQELIYYFYGEVKDVWSDTDTFNFFELWCNFASSFKESLLKEHENIVVKRRNDFNKADTKIVPICPSGLKLKVKCRTGNKARFSQSSKPVKIY